MSGRTPWGVALDELLADGEWHDIYTEVLPAATRAVPPGPAYRSGERLRSGQRARRAAQTQDRVRGDHGTAVATGARRLVTDAIASRIRKGTVERQGDRVRSVR